MRKKGFTLIELLVVIAIIGVLALAFVPGIVKVVDQKTVTVTVTDKGIKKGDESDKYLIYTDNGVYEITDSLFKWRWNSSDLYGEIKRDTTYEFEVGGKRIPFLSMYPNIYTAREVVIEVPTEPATETSTEATT